MSLFRIHTRALGRLTADERGISLIVAVMSLLVLSIMVGSVAVYTTKNLHSTFSDRSSTSAYHLAEAGLNEAIGRLTAAADPRVTTILPSTTVSYQDLGGSVTYVGTAVKVVGPPEQVVWTVTATGLASAGQARQKTLSQQVTVKGLVPGGDLGSWSRFYQDDASPLNCLTIDSVTMPAPIATPGDLCLINGGAVTGSKSTIDIGGNVYVLGPTVNTGVRSPVTATTPTPGVPVWVSPANSVSNNTTYATDLISASSSGGTLAVSNFGFTIPASAKILGISVDVKRKASLASKIRDVSVQLQKVAGAGVGSNQADTASFWGTTDSTPTYGASDDLWGTTWTATEIDNSAFGLRFQAKNGDTTTQRTASVDWVNITVTYTNTTTGGVGTSTTNIDTATIGGTCTYNGQTPGNPCTATDHVWANNIVKSAISPTIDLPKPDFNYWYQEGRPGPKHYCTNTGNNFSPNEFDNNSTYDKSLTFNNASAYDMTPTTRDYDCQYWENGVMLGQLKWDHTQHLLTVSGSIFFDGDVRFDDDGQVVHYSGRAIIYAARDVEFDELVCAGGTGTTSCISTMSSWTPAHDYLVLQAGRNSEYDQGSTNCSGPLPDGIACVAGHPASGFQGVVAAQGDCKIHQGFQLSGPVICNTISLPYESAAMPTYSSFPSLDQLVDGQKYGDIDTATAFEIQPGAQTG